MDQNHASIAANSTKKNSATAATVEEGEGWHVEVNPQPLELLKYTAWVTDPEAGAISTFIGTTRNNFDGKAVLKLEYEAYVPMAIKKMKEVCAIATSQWGITKIAVAHRIGTVAVCEASVIIAISSPHRKAALEACAWAIDELKASVPIWKEEFFENGSVWKENAESRARFAAKASGS